MDFDVQSSFFLGLEYLLPSPRKDSDVRAYTTHLQRLIEGVMEIVAFASVSKIARALPLVT